LALFFELFVIPKRPINRAFSLTML